MGSTSSSGRSSASSSSMLAPAVPASCSKDRATSVAHDRQVGGLPVERQRAGLGQAERPQVLDQAGEHAGLLEDRAEMLLRRPGRRHRRSLRVALDDAEWRAQLVADLGEQPSALHLVDLEARRHGVERAHRSRSSPRAAVDLRHARRVVAGLDPPGRLDEGIQRGPDAPCEPNPEQDRDPARNQDDRDCRAGQVRQRARVGDEAQQRAEDPQPDDADGDEDEREQDDETPEAPRHAPSLPRRSATSRSRPRGPHHGGPLHSCGGHGSSSGHQPGR